MNFLAGQKHDITFVNYNLPPPPIPDDDGDLLVVVAPGGDEAASQLSKYATPLPEKAVSVPPGAGSYQFFVVYNHLREVREAVEAEAVPGDAVLFISPGGAEQFRPFYNGPVPVLQLPAPSENGTAALAGVEQAAVQHSRLFVVHKGGENADPGSTIDEWLIENTFQAYDIWLGDLRFALYATHQPDDRGREQSVGTDLRRTTTAGRLGDCTARFCRRTR